MIEALLGTSQGPSKTKGWLKYPNTQIGRRYHSGAGVGDYMYIFGGYGPTAPTTYNEFKRYNTKLDTWETLPTGPPARQQAVMVAVGNKLYLYGGNNSSTRYNDFWCYDIDAGTWTSLTVTGITTRNNPSAAVIGTDIYIVGGDNFNYTSYFRDVWRYDTVAKTWNACALIPVATVAGAMVGLKGNLYYYGGMTSNTSYRNTVYKYSPADNSWTILANAPYTSQKSAMSVIGDLAYLFGGNNGINFNTLYSFDGTAWVPVVMPAPIPLACYGHTLVTVNDQLWAFGGTATGLTYNNELWRAQV